MSDRVRSPASGTAHGGWGCAVRVLSVRGDALAAVGSWDARVLCYGSSYQDLRRISFKIYFNLTRVSSNFYRIRTMAQALPLAHAASNSMSPRTTFPCARHPHAHRHGPHPNSWKPREVTTTRFVRTGCKAYKRRQVIYPRSGAPHRGLCPPNRKVLHSG